MRKLLVPATFISTVLLALSASAGDVVTGQVCSEKGFVDPKLVCEVITYVPSGAPADPNFILLRDAAPSAE